MKAKRILSALLVLAVTLSLLPNVAFAGDNYAITNGTPESAKETNHGYITIDKATAAENDTVTVTVNPADGYQLKSLTVAPTGFVDLGIKDAEGKPLYWKETNLGANNASDPGDYYMWGATALMYSAVDRSKTSGAFTFVTENPYGDNYKNTWDASLGFNWNNVPFTDGVFNNASNRNVFTKYTTIDTYAKSGTPDNITALQPEDDAATAENENWRMPTKDELVALATNCVLVWTSDYNSTGNPGYIVYKAKNDTDKGKANVNGTWKMWDVDNSKYIDDTGSAPTGYSTSDIHIFLPAAGSSTENKLNNLNTGAVYWSGTLGSNNDVAYALTTMKIGISLGQGQRQYGYSIRPVMNFSGITPAKQTDGTYQFTMPGYAVTVTAEFEEKAITIADIIATYENFPLTKDEDLYWTNKQGTTCYYFNNNLFFRYTSTKSLLQSMTVSVAADGKNYTYSDGTVTYTFIMDDSGVLAAITVSGSTDIKYNGTYGAPPTKYTVTFDANGGSVMPTSAVTGTDGKLATLPTPTRSGYSFVGWYTAASGGTKITAEKVYTADTAIYAHWAGPLSFADLPTGVSDITVSEGDEEIGTAIKDAFVLYCKDNIKADGEYAFIDYRFEDGGTFYHTWIVKIQSGTVTAADGGSSNLDGVLYAVNHPVFDWWINGAYSAIHTHAFTYTANNGKITATCVDGCDKGYDTKPLTLTLTAPASLVYDGNAKAFTFANGEADAWTNAGLELPEIIYYVKQSGQSTYMPLLGTLKSVGDYMAEITVNNKAAQIEFTITRRSSGGGVSSYTIKFETNGGNVLKNVSVRVGQKIGTIETPKKEGFVFDGWFSDKELTKPYNADDKVTKSTTLYAGWKVDPVRQITLTIGKKEAIVFTEEKVNDVAPKIVNDRTMLPIRFIAEALGATVDWNGEKELVTISNEGLKIEITIGKDVAFVNGNEVKLDSPAFIENDRTYLPLRFVAENLGAEVLWVEETQQVVITKAIPEKTTTK